MDTLAPGTVLDRYEIVSLIGSGGMGEVYRARDPRLDRQVAIKIMRIAFRDNAHVVRRFEQEARAAATLSHPNILAVYDVGIHDGQPYIVTELLDGRSLRQVIEQPLPIHTAVQYTVEMCHGLAAAHERGIVHRDLKPENLFVTRDGHVKILDFGLAKLTEEPQTRVGTTGTATQTALTTANTILGTVGYMSPEQVSGRAVDHRSDIFSTGAVLYELISGRRAFAGDSAAETLSAVLKDEPPEVAVEDRMSAGVFRVVRHCLEKDRAHRFQSVRDLAFALETIAADGNLAGAPRGSWRPSGPTAAHSAGPYRLIVLPFENLSRQGDDEWLAAALSDSLTFGLRNVENIIIVNRQHAGAFTDLQQLFGALDVRYCVKGTYQRVGEDLKVLVRLIDAQTGAIAVQESVTDRFSNLLSLEDTIAARFAAAFEETREAPPRRTASLSAYKRVSQARELQLTGRYEEAAYDLEMAVKHDPKYPDAWALLANSYGRLTSPATADDSARVAYQRKALAAAERAVQLDPSLYEAQIALALTYRGMENVELWRTAALKATELNPRLPEAYVLLGQSYFASPAWGCARHRDSDLAERYFRKALQLDPRFGLAHNALIYHLTWAGRASEGLRAADEALRVLPDHMDLIRARAITLLQLGQIDGVEEQLAHLTTESANSVQDEWVLAAIDLLRGRLERAATRFEAVIARGPRCLREIDTSLIYCRISDFDRAATHLTEACGADQACATFVQQCQLFVEYRRNPAIASVLSNGPRSEGRQGAAGTSA